jgi:hypothetical protein
MSDRERDQVEDPSAHPDIRTARNLPDAANAQQSIQGYAAINGDEREEIARIAYDLYQQRGEEHGDADADWFRAEAEVRRRRQQRGS